MNNFEYIFLELYQKVSDGNLFFWLSVLTHHVNYLNFKFTDSHLDKLDNKICFNITLKNSLLDLFESVFTREQNAQLE